MTTTYINKGAFEFVAETIVALEDAYAQRAELERDDSEYFWTNQGIQELNFELCSLISFDEAHEGV